MNQITNSQSEPRCEISKGQVVAQHIEQISFKVCALTIGGLQK